MKIFVYIVIIIIKVLIEIGDFTLFLIKLPISLVEVLFKVILRLVKLLAKGLTKLFKRILGYLYLVKVSAQVFLLKFKLRFPKKTSKPKKIKRIKIKREKVAKFAPSPIFTKVKYLLIGAIASFFLIFIPLLFLIFLQNLPSPKILDGAEIAQTTKIYDRNGKLLYQIYANQNRTIVPLSNIPKNLKDATIAIEDKDFYKNPGFDITAMVRAAIADLSGKPLQGGSTITQQLIKSSLLSSEVSVSRKIKEIVLAFWAEQIYTKDQILQMYFNQVPYGGTAWGVEAAAQTYFGKSVKDLDLAQASFLAGMPKAPSVYSPYGENPNLWKKRQVEVLGRMQELGMISKQQKEDAQNEELIFEQAQTPIKAPHFVMYIKDYLIKKYGLPMVEKGGLSVTTSLDLNMQEMAEEIVREEVNNDYYYNLTNGAALVTNPKNGDILAMVGSKDYEDPIGGNFNVTTATRQPGSTIKAVTYAASLSNGFTAASLINDSPIVFKNPGAEDYAPVNYDGAFRGQITLRNALGNSINIPAVKVLNKIGISTMVDLGKRMGITTWGDPTNYGLAITLGAAEVKMTDLAVAYGTLANQGERVNLNPILKIGDSRGNILFEKKSAIKTRVLDSGVAFIISDILADNNARLIEFGANTPLNVSGKVVSVKTGTSNNIRDNWTIGYTPSVLVAVWVGNNDNTPMSGIASGITGAAPIWNKLMVNLTLNKPRETQPVPADIVAKFCTGRTEYFVKGTEKLANCNFIATPSAIPLAAN
jgi:1A family penicillin-binding protein